MCERSMPQLLSLIDQDKFHVLYDHCSACCKPVLSLSADNANFSQFAPVLTEWVHVVKECATATHSPGSMQV